MLGSHFNEHLLLITLFMKLFVPIINPLSWETIFRVNMNHIKAGTATWSRILDVTFLMILAAIVNTPSSRQAFVRVSNQRKTTMFTFWTLAFHVALWMVCLKNEWHKNLVCIFDNFCSNHGMSKAMTLELKLLNSDLWEHERNLWITPVSKVISYEADGIVKPEWKMLTINSMYALKLT